jgi:lactoylglutathione lyase
MQAIGLRYELFVDDVERACDFYEQVLGFSRQPVIPGESYTPISNGPVKIGIELATELPNDHHFNQEKLAGHRGAGLEIVIEVDDVDAFYERATALIQSVQGQVEPIRDSSWGLRDFRVIDPDGYYTRVTSTG